MAKKPQKLWLRRWVCVTAFPRNTAAALPTSLQSDLSHMHKSSHPPEGLECQYSPLDLWPYAVNLPVATPCLPTSHSRRLAGERGDSTCKQFASNLERRGPRSLLLLTHLREHASFISSECLPVRCGAGLGR